MYFSLIFYRYGLPHIFNLKARHAATICITEGDDPQLSLSKRDRAQFDMGVTTFS